MSHHHYYHPSFALSTAATHPIPSEPFPVLFVLFHRHHGFCSWTVLGHSFTELEAKAPPVQGDQRSLSRGNGNSKPRGLLVGRCMFVFCNGSSSFVLWIRRPGHDSYDGSTCEGRSLAPCHVFSAIRHRTNLFHVLCSWPSPPSLLFREYARNN